MPKRRAYAFLTDRVRRRRLRRGTVLLLAGVLAMSATACGSSSGHGGAVGLPRQAADRLAQLGVDLDQWRSGGWRNWDKDDWLREAGDFVNPVVDGVWGTDRMDQAREPGKTVPSDVAVGQGVTDPEPAPVPAQPVATPYRVNAAAVGKVFFDGPEGAMVCSATVVEDPANPGKSNLVWTAGHCVHAGRNGGWFRNIAFVPSFNDTGASAGGLGSLPPEQVAPFGTWWADGATTSQQWIAEGASTGGAGAPYDFAVLHVGRAQGGDGRSLEETVGSALPVRFNGPQAPDVPQLGAWGYPAAAPFDGATMQACTDRPGRLSLTAADPTMYRIGCTMTGGSSGGGWFARDADGRLALVSNTSIGPEPAAWLAGPYLGDVAQRVFADFSRSFTEGAGTG